MNKYKIPAEIIQAVTVKNPNSVLKKTILSMNIIVPIKIDRRTLPPIYKFLE
jgi:hypothetical protein